MRSIITMGRKHRQILVPQGGALYYVPPGAERRAEMAREWYEENSPGQRVQLNAAKLPTVNAVVPVMEVRDFGKPQAVTLQLDNNVVTPGVNNAQVRARIEYGIGGASDVFECDWADGGLVTVVAQRLTVVARGDLINPDNPYDMGAQVFEVVASVGEGQPSVIMPTFTEQKATIAPTTVAGAFDPPPFAKAVSIYAQNETNTFADPYPDFQAVWFSQSGGTLMGRTEGAYIGGGSAIPIPNNATLFIRNTSATDDIRPTLIWHLGL